MNRQNPSDVHACWLHTRLTRAESEAFDSLVKSLGTTRAEFMRKVVRESANAGPEPIKNEMAAFREAVYQLGAVGRNFNQMVRAINSGDRVDPQKFQETFLGIRAALETLDRELKALVTRSRQRWLPHDGQTAA